MNLVLEVIARRLVLLLAFLAHLQALFQRMEVLVHGLHVSVNAFVFWVIAH